MTLSQIRNAVERLNNDVNGNPRFYVSLFELASFCKVDLDWLEKRLGVLKLKAYRGREFGAGVVLTSYNLGVDLSNIYYKVQRLKIVADNLSRLGASDYRMRGSIVQIKKGRFWHNYDDKALNLYNGIDKLTND